MKKKTYEYLNLALVIIFFILGMYYYGKAYGAELFAYDYEGKVYAFQHPIAIQHMNRYFAALEYDDCRTNTQFRQFHKENGERCYNDAKDRCWWLPYLSERDKARYCISNIGVLACPGEPKSKLIIALVNMLIQYGIDCSEEWHYINNKLYWSQYHFEMMEFYDNLIKKGYP